MTTIYEPNGKAREYSPLALNIYNGCDHNCEYCYCRTMPFIKFSDKPEAKKGILEQLEKDAHKFSNGKQVLLCFTSDPYCNEDVKTGLTRKVLEILLKNNVNTAILSKGGKRCLRDLDLFRKFKKIKVGATLTFLNNDQSFKYEPNAALPLDRIDTLKKLHENNITTFASLEPVLDPKQTLEIISKTYEFIDIYKVGKMNYHPIAKNIDWKEFGDQAIDLLNSYKKRYYIKEDLRKFCDQKKLNKFNSSMDNI